MINPEVKEGDRIICYHMEGELGVPPGTKGTVRAVGRDPFEFTNDERIIRVNWDNGSQLSLLTTTDFWKLDKERVSEAVEEPAEYSAFKKSADIFENFDWRYIRDYLVAVRDAGPVNMIEAGPFLIGGKEWVERYYGEGREDDPRFQKVLEMADTARDKMIAGTVNYLNKTKDEWELEDAEQYLRRFAKKMMAVYVSFPIPNR
jgi:hypothetical protein